MTIALTPEQHAAVARAVESPLSVLTGGPGTGKTTTTNAILDALGRPQSVVLAPTGKAAKRASEVTGHRAMTIHSWTLRAESCSSGEWTGSLEHHCVPNVVLDESSMLATDTAAAFLRVWRGQRLVIVGDVDQLPSIGAGSVLADLIRSGRVPVTRLTAVQRQAEGSAIVAVAHAINAGKRPPMRPADDLRFVRIETLGAREADHVAWIVGEEAKRLGCDPRRDVQVLAGLRRDVDALNAAIRARFNPPDGTPEVGGFRARDKVLCTVNDRDLGVVNGDVGDVREVRPAKAGMAPAVVVEIHGGGVVEFAGEKVGRLRQAWAMTVHKAQGSEYRSVIHCLTPQGARVFGRAHLYTAVTRARESLVVVTTPQAWAVAVGAESENRHTRLAGLLRADA